MDAHVDVLTPLRTVLPLDIWYFVGTCLFYLFVHMIVKNGIISPLRNIPGPRIAGLTSWYETFVVIFCKSHLIWADLHRQHGPIVRRGPNKVSFATLEAAKEIYGSSKYVKTSFYQCFEITGPSTFSTPDVSFHHSRRRIIAPSYSQSSLNKIEYLIWDSGIGALMDKLSRLSRTAPRQANLYKEFHCMAFDIIGEISFGQSFGMLQAEGEHPFLIWRDDSQRLIDAKAVLPIAELLANYGLIFRRAKEAQEKQKQFAYEALARRRALRTKRQDVLQMLFEAKDEVTGEPLDDDALTAEILLQVGAGTDTTSNTLTWAFMLLMQHPMALDKLRAELDEAFVVLDERIVYDQVKHLPYLDAVLNETFRLKPVAAAPLPRLVPEGGAMIDGHFIPGGTIVSVPLFAIQRDKAVWGEDAEEFVPERWLDVEAPLQMMKNSIFPFSRGPRVCLGRNLAMMEVKLAMAAVIRRFTLQYIPGQDYNDSNSAILKPQQQRYMVGLEERTS